MKKRQLKKYSIYYDIIDSVFQEVEAYTEEEALEKAMKEEYNLVDEDSITIEEIE